MNDFVLLALRNVGKRKKRTGLTMIGVFIGIAAVVALISLGQGLQQTINAQFEKAGADKILIQAKEVGFGGAHAPGQLKQREVDLIKQVSGVKEATGMLARAGKIKFNNVQRTVFFLSVPKKQKEADLVTQFHTWEVEEGRLLTSKDHKKVAIGSTLANGGTFKKDVHTGDKIELNGDSYDVVGILKKIGDPGSDNSAILGEEDLRVSINEKESYSMIVAQSKEKTPEEVAYEIGKTLRRDRHQKEGKEDFSVQTSTQLIGSFNAALNIIQVIFVGIAAISLIVGGIGIMNTMFTAVLERTQEIGVMKAVGAKNSDILLIFMVESAIVGFLGGLAGIVIGASISKGVEFGANTMFGARTLVAAFPWYLILGALVFSTVVGTLSGAVPARRASKLKPIEALRYD